ncbi:MAG: zinc-binding alcohol dehydrogenase family protein [Gammaproteobacteria bacterium]
MKAIGYQAAGPITAENSLIAFDAPAPQIGPRDLLVDVRAVSVNPVDTKVRANMAPESGTKIIGYDAAGTVLAVGSDVCLFSVGDEVFYAGDLTRPGTNSAQHAVDERIVGKKPATLGFADAAALPLTAITAWEMLFDSFGLAEGAGDGESILVIGGAGGVGSIMIQLASHLTKLDVIATASRPDTVEWAKKMGADHVINHHAPLGEQLSALGAVPRYVACLTATDQHFDSVVGLIAPRGHIAVIDDPASLDILPLKRKALSVSWEFMFTRSMFQTDDMIKQHELLDRVSTLVDAGALQTTATQNLGQLGVASLKAAHTLQESGRAIGKTVLEGFAN